MSSNLSDVKSIFGRAAEIGSLAETHVQSDADVRPHPESQQLIDTRTRQVTTVVRHVLWHTKSVPENVDAELLRRI